MTSAEGSDDQHAYDYVVVGAGVAGSIVAARLSDDPRTTVLLLEAGQELDDTPQTRHPERSAELLGTEADWAHTTEPQSGLGGRTVGWHAGRAVGGSSAVNASLWLRGGAADYDAWAAYGPGWDWAAALDAFRRHEGEGRGPLPVQASGEHPLKQAVFAAAGELGLVRGDHLSVRPEGVDTLRLTARDGRRVTFADAFLGPARRRPNLRVVTGAQATRVETAAGRARGVTYRRDGGPPSTATARREVLLAAGAVRTPHLLLLSGIGPEDHLASLGIPVVAALPGVGRNLQDHICVGGSFRAAPDSRPVDGEGAGGASAGAVVLARSGLGAEDPDIEIVLAPAAGGGGPGVTLGVIALQPRSRGTVRLADADPLVPPLIDPGYLGDPSGEDLAVLRAGSRLAQRLLRTRALAPYAADPADLGFRDGATDDEVDAFVRRTASGMFHPAGTARFGPPGDPDAVLGADLRVRGIDGLRVVDASAIPLLNRGHSMAPTAVVAERAAGLVLTDDTYTTTDAGAHEAKEPQP
ncbi:GMC family oxidoreductase [Streptomyces sp. NPDC002125]